MRRALAIAVTACLLTATDALAQAGGGSGGFGGGGGGGGGFGGGGGSGSGSGEGSWESVAVIVVIALVFLAVSVVADLRYRRRRRARVRRVALAAAEAAEEDAIFAPAAVTTVARELYLAIQAAWDARDRARLRALVGTELLEEWDRRLDDFEQKGWHNRVAVLGEPELEYVGLTNREGAEEDRVVVRFEAQLRSYVETSGGKRILKTGAKSEVVRVCEYWTLARGGTGWTLESIEQREEGDHHLSAEIVATPWSDTERLRAEAVAERAAADAAPAGTHPAELADLDFDGEARAAALDLALADGRFDPDLIEASVRRAVAAWAQAVDGEDTALAEVSRAEAATHLLHPGDPSRRTRLVVRGPRIDSVRIAGLDAAAAPPAIAVAVEVTGARYVEDRATAAVVSGTKESETTFTEHWTLGLEGPPDWPWRIIAAGAA